MRTFVLALTLAAACGAADFEVLPGQRILLKGDSIVKGYAFGNYTDPSPLRTLYEIMGILLKDNLSAAPAVHRMPLIWEGANPDGSPKTVDSAAGEIKRNIRQGDLRPGDWLIFEDAGQIDLIAQPAPASIRKNMYRNYRKMLRDMVLEAETAVGRDHIVLMTMFDYNPAYAFCAWDAPLDDGVHSANDAIRDEATALGVRVLDMNAVMDRAHKYVQARGWGRMVGFDGIHPNVYGNSVMVFAILRALGADIEYWKLDGLHPPLLAAKDIWGFEKNPTAEQRVTILRDLRDIVANTANLTTTPVMPRTLIRHGRVLDHPTTQPEGTSRTVSYEIGKLFQLDQENVLLTASLREMGGHDFAVGNDGVVFSKLSEILPARAFAINRLDPSYKLKVTGAPAVLAKFPINGGFLPLGTGLPGAGSGFFLSTASAFAADRTDHLAKGEQFVEIMQVRWNGKKLTVTKDELPEPWRSQLNNIGFNCLLENGTFLCPLISPDGVSVTRFEYVNKKWKPAAQGKPFAINKPEVEASLRKDGDHYLVYTRGTRDPRGRVYRSLDGLNFYFAFDRWNWTVPQGFNQRLDGSFYVATNTGPGWLRNPLVAFTLRGQSFVDPVIIHDVKQICDDKGAEVPFADHGVGENVTLEGRRRHLLLYRVCDLNETNGKGAPPTPQTGLYLAEMESPK